MTPYILHVSLLLAACLLFYKLLLQKETFFRLNRLVLLACFVLSFTLPLLQVPAEWSLRRHNPSPVVLPAESLLQTGIVPDESTAGQTTDTTASRTGSVPSLLQWALWLYWFGVAVFGLNFLIQLALLLYQAYTRPVIRDGRFRIVEVSGDKAPCSFANNIFINPEKYDWETYNQILLHEKIHIQQGHSWDLLMAEVVIIFQWFNPFAWLYRKELENNLEFLTDSALLQQHAVEKADYQMSLLKVSAPQFPLSLTTNYNQSLLKKRFVMMNAKKSNLHTTWKYFFLFPLLALMVSLLNEPISAQTTQARENRESNNIHSASIKTEGAWFATIKDDRITIQFKGDEDEQSTNSSTYPLSDFSNLPRERSGSFSLSRDAGTMEFTGKFEGEQGMGRYKFSANNSFREFLTAAGVPETDDEDMMVFFMVNVNRGFVQMLQANGYKSFEKNDLVPLAALKVDGNYIQSLTKTLGKVELQTLIPLKALGVDQAYVQDIHKVYPQADAQQMITLKAQGIDSKFINDVRSSMGRDGGKKEDQKNRDERDDEDTDAGNIVAIKALNIDAAYINSLKEAGYDNLSSSELVAMKAQGITAEWIRDMKSMGFRDLAVPHLIGIKAQNITPEYIRSLEALGFKGIEPADIIAVKALGITAEYIRDFKNNGYPDITLREAVPLKAQGITLATVREYKALGFENLSLNDVIAARATGTTPAFISSMKEKGHNLKSIDKYIQLKNAVE